MVVGKLDVLVRRGRCATLELCAQAWDIFDALQTERRIPIKALFRIGRDVIRLRTGETTGQVLSCETGLIPRCRSHSVEEKATSSHGEWLAWQEPRAVGDLVHVEKFFARNLGSLIHARTRVPGRLGKATSRPLLSTPRGRLYHYWRLST